MTNKHMAGAALALSALVALQGCSSKANSGYVPKPEEAVPAATITPGNEASLFPLDKGNQWTYDISITRVVNAVPQRPTTNLEATWKVTNSKSTGKGTTQATITVIQNGKQQDIQTFMINSKGIFQVSDGKPPVEFKPPMPVITFPVKPEATFDWEGTGPTGLGSAGPHKSSSTILPSQKVDTDMGPMDAIPVESYTSIQAGKIQGKSFSAVYFTPGTGIVRLRQEALVGDKGYILVMKLKSKSLMKS